MVFTFGLNKVTLTLHFFSLSLAVWSTLMKGALTRLMSLPYFRSGEWLMCMRPHPLSGIYASWIAMWLPWHHSQCGHSEYNSNWSVNLRVGRTHHELHLCTWSTVADLDGVPWVPWNPPFHLNNILKLSLTPQFPLTGQQRAVYWPSHCQWTQSR